MIRKVIYVIIMATFLAFAGHPANVEVASAKEASDYSLVPPFVSAQVPPLVMLVMERDHKLYYEAYNDASDLDGDGALDVGYKPDDIDYYGYFDCYKCYEYNSGSQLFEPYSVTTDKKCSGANEWSGDFLNYLTMSRMDALRKVLYGGYRSTDTNTDTVLERAYIPRDGHSWGKEYKDIATDGYDIRDYTPFNLPNANTRHLFACTATAQDGDPKLRYLLNIGIGGTTGLDIRIWNWVSIERPVAMNQVARPGQPNNKINVSPSEVVVRVQVCDATMPEKNCQLYPGADETPGTADDVYKPTGILQKYGENELMYFGLISGSYAKNTSGGVLRKNMSSITDEIDSKTGQFTSVNGIIKTIDKFRIKNFRYSDNSYYPGWSGAWVTTRAMNEGEFTDWGNPTAEMMYEGLRYFSGAASPTSEFVYSTGDDVSLGLPLATWQDPYSTYPECSKPFMLVISDINPSYDSNQLPGSDSNFATAISTSLGSMDVETILDSISSNEGISGDYYIGQVGSTFDSSCSAKTISSLGNVRGLCAEEPTKQGSYYSAAVSYFGLKEDIHATADGSQNVTTYTVALASPLPRIEIPIADQTITLVPFAKSVGGCLGIAPTNPFTPTNTIVDFYVEEITDTYGKFSINFEDVEQAADHDMDAIAVYEYQVYKSDNTKAATAAEGAYVKIALKSDFAAGCVIQHMGYIISGTTADGTYLEIRDADTGAGNDVDYFLDTPNTTADLPLDTGPLPNDGSLAGGRRFDPGTSGAASLLENPLYYAAKWGGFRDRNSDGLGPSGGNTPDDSKEWDEDNDGVPDTYFYVQNPLFLEQKLNETFADILRRVSAGTAASVISSTRSGEGAIYQAVFYPEFRDSFGNSADWVGEVHALLVDAQGRMREDSCGDAGPDPNGNDRLDVSGTPCADEIIDFNASQPGMAKRVTAGTEVPIEDLNYMWTAGGWLNEISDSEIVQQRGTYITHVARRYIFTFVDEDKDMVPDDGGSIDNDDETVHFVHGLATAGSISGNGLGIGDLLKTPIATTLPNPEDVIKFIRGLDDASTTGFRPRQVDYDSDNDVNTWRLGDIVYSTPTVVAAPAEDYDLLYDDESYIPFFNKYRRRRQVVYTGANDGMLHAFNGGFFNAADNGFYTQWDSTNGYTNPATGAPDLGAELWGYVPYNLLPHLYWLTEEDYGVEGEDIVHVPYVDLKPRVFDAKIFADDTDHPNGWGTVLVVGMNFGGGEIWADTDTGGTDNSYDSGEPVMRSAVIVLDITNPEAPPRLLAEIQFPELGFTTSFPAVIVMKDKEPASDPNKWYLLLGSGPHGSTSDTGASGGPDFTALNTGTSDQPGKIVIVDLSELALTAGSKVRTLRNNGVLQDGIQIYTSLDTNSFIGDPVVVDYQLDYRADVVYFGTIANVDNDPDIKGWDGKLRRLVINNDATEANWDSDSVLIDVTDNTSPSIGQPIVAPATVGIDGEGQRWVFFGTGRFYYRSDVDPGGPPPITPKDNPVQSFYGIKEPYVLDMGGDRVYNYTAGVNETVARSDLVDVTTAEVDTDGVVSNVAGLTAPDNTFDDLLELTLSPKPDGTMGDKKGWFIDLKENPSQSDPQERNLGQATLLGDVLTFTTYIPDNDVCAFEGTSNLYFPYFGTGTAFHEIILTSGGETAGVVKRKESLGQGLSVTPNIHVGREKGSKAFIQTSTGNIVVLQESNPGATKSGKVSWEEE
jgi:type IV pilus assembly protein PilY1